MIHMSVLWKGEDGDYELLRQHLDNQDHQPPMMDDVSSDVITARN